MSKETVTEVSVRQRLPAVGRATIPNHESQTRVGLLLDLGRMRSPSQGRSARRINSISDSSENGF